MTAETDVLLLLGRTVQASLRVLTERLLLALALAASAGAFAWALAVPDPMRLAGACAFALLVYWPLVALERRRHPEPSREA